MAGSARPGSAGVISISRRARAARGLLAHGAREQSRALHRVEGIAHFQAQLLALIGTTPRKKRLRRAKVSIGSLGQFSSYGYNGGFGDDYEDDEDAEQYTANAGGETFGNQALQQLLGLAKQLAPKPPAPDLAGLTEALATAQSKGLGEEVVSGLKAKLAAALALPAPGDAPALPAPAETKEVAP